MKIQFVDADSEYKGNAYLEMGDSTKEFIYEWAVLELLAEDILFVACGEDGYLRTTLMVNCNDVFTWGSADCEDIPAYKLEDLYIMWQKDSRWGATKWCCIHRNMQPQTPVIRDMKTDGVWDEIMENLPDNSWEKAAKEKDHYA